MAFFITEGGAYLLTHEGEYLLSGPLSPVPATLGQFTGQLGTSLSFLANIALAKSGTAVGPGRVVSRRWRADTLPTLQWGLTTPPVLFWNAAVAAPRNWEMFLGEDVTILCQPEVPGGPVTTWTIVLTVADSTGAVVISKTATIADGPNGIFTFTIAHADTANLGVGTYTYDASRTDTGADTVLLSGAIAMSRRGGGGT